MKNIKLDLKWILIGVLSIALLWSFRTCNQKEKQISQLQLDKQTLDSMVNTLGQTIYTQQAIETNDKQAIKHLTDSIFNLTRKQDKKIKDAIAYYKETNKIQIKDKLVPYIDTVSRKKWEDSITKKCDTVINYYETNYIKVPMQAVDTSSKDYKVYLTVLKSGIKIDSLDISDSQYIRFVTIKGGILKKDASGKRHLFTKRSIQVQVLHTNSLIKVTGQNSAIYVEPKKGRWLEKALLIGTGILLGTQLNK